jgi:hypothetical protein
MPDKPILVDVVPRTRIKDARFRDRIINVLPRARIYDLKRTSKDG